MLFKSPASYIGKNLRDIEEVATLTCLIAGFDDDLRRVCKVR